MGGRRRVGRRVHIPPNAIGSGARVTDFFPIPVPLFLLARLVRFIYRHWYVSLLILSYLFLPLWTFLLITLGVPMLIFGRLWITNRHVSLPGIARAARHLYRSKVKWRQACEAAGLNDGPHRPALTSVYPWRPVKITSSSGHSLEFILNLGKIGQTTRHLEENREYLAAVLGARRTRIYRITPGLARLTIEWEKNLSKSVVANPAQQINDTQLPRITLDQDVTLELDTSLLVVGESGSGKSNLTWYVLSQLNEYGITYRLYVIDPKKVELADLVDSPNLVKYSDSPNTADIVIDAFYDDMMATFEDMKRQQIRKVILGPDYAAGERPLNILLIDELLLCAQAKKGIDTHLGECMASGRAAGFIVLGNSQLGQVDALSRLRDLFPQRVCMAVKSGDLTDAVLGPKAEARGARCTEITEKGVGYIYTDHSGSFQRFRPPLIMDTKAIAIGQKYVDPFSTPHTTIKEKLEKRKNSRCYTYRLYDQYGILLYVGKAFNPNERISQHTDKPWFHAIQHGRTVIKKYPTEAAAFEAEQEAIENEKPRYNLVHNFKGD